MPRPSRAALDAEIVDAATALFATRGYPGTSVREIADRVGYSKTGLLHRYPSKEALLVAVLRGPLTEFAALRATWNALPAGPERASVAAGDLVGLALRHRGALALLSHAGLPVLPDALAVLIGGADIGRHRAETLAALADPADIEATVRAELAVTGLVHTVAARQETPADDLRGPLLRAFRDAAGLTAVRDGGAP
ncbi:TetR/AcrR family transcriptional regulator [Streptomyces sp. P6-2-1]|uniref:TetR/AcrR family transcriptional regulator n=1 Tax=Streptomyces sp. P6-2-1 TaxID=3422591 RepID=UPI003D368529